MFAQWARSPDWDRRIQIAPPQPSEFASNSLQNTPDRVGGLNHWFSGVCGCVGSGSGRTVVRFRGERNGLIEQLFALTEQQRQQILARIKRLVEG
jgi:hypothetical protein